MQKFHLAQVNIAKCLAPLDDPIMQDFVKNTKRINELADNSEGFVWRLQDENKDEVSQIFNNDSLIVNLSVWESLEALFNYTYQSGHVEVFKRKKEWFSKIETNHMAFWYLPEGTTPTLQDAKNRLDYLDTNGSSPMAFTFKNKFTVNDFLNHKPLKTL